MLKAIEAAIANHQALLEDVVRQAADPNARSNVGAIGLLRNDLAALYTMRREEEQRAEIARNVADAE